MGLLLSVLVVCVGVLEVIACVRHFQDGYLPLWTPHCAVTSGYAKTHERWRNKPSDSYEFRSTNDVSGALNHAQDQSSETFLQPSLSVENGYTVKHECEDSKKEITPSKEIHQLRGDTLPPFKDENRITDLHGTDIVPETSGTEESNLNLISTYDKELNIPTNEYDERREISTNYINPNLILELNDKHVESTDSQFEVLLNTTDSNVQLSYRGEETKLDIPSNEEGKYSNIKDELEQVSLLNKDVVLGNSAGETSNILSDKHTITDVYNVHQISGEETVPSEILEKLETSTRFKYDLDKPEDSSDDQIQNTKISSFKEEIILQVPVTAEASKDTPIYDSETTFSTPVESICVSNVPDNNQELETDLESHRFGSVIHHGYKTESLEYVPLSENQNKSEITFSHEENLEENTLSNALRHVPEIKSQGFKTEVQDENYTCLQKEIDIVTDVEHIACVDVDEDARNSRISVQHINEEYVPLTNYEIRSEITGDGVSEDRLEEIKVISKKQNVIEEPQNASFTQISSEAHRPQQELDEISKEDAFETFHINEEDKQIEDYRENTPQAILEEGNKIPEIETTQSLHENVSEDQHEIPEKRPEPVLLIVERDVVETDGVEDTSESRLESQTTSTEFVTSKKKEAEQEVEVLATKPEIPTEINKHLAASPLTIDTSEESPNLTRHPPHQSSMSPPQLPSTPTKKSKADISWPTFFPGAPVIKRPSVSFATPEAVFTNEDQELLRQYAEEAIDITPCIKKTEETCSVTESEDKTPSSTEDKSLESVEASEKNDSFEEDIPITFKERSPSNIVAGNDFSRKELQLQRRKSYKHKRYSSASELNTKEEETEDRSFSENKPTIVRASSLKESRRRYRKPAKASSFEDCMLLETSKTKEEESAVKKVGDSSSIPVIEEKETESQRERVVSFEEVAKEENKERGDHQSESRQRNESNASKLQYEGRIEESDSRREEKDEEDSSCSVSEEQSSSQQKSPAKEAFWLIFSGEYTKAMSKDWHSGHFCCWQCDESLTGQRYVLRDDHPYCIKCYESLFANVCEECNKTIGIDSKDLSYKDKHWHEACFLCNKCRVSLVDKQFGSKADKIYCGNCYDAQFASRCDGCGEIFRAGTKKMEYKTRQWHEKCFCCCVCKTAIGTKSFIPREQEIYCATCYEEKFATRCVKCNKIITSGGVTYKNEPWHRECFTCTNCNTSLAGQRFTSRDEKPYCADCFGELFAKRCTACSKPITGIGGTRFISFEDRHWHNDCFICATCKTSLVGRGFITDADDIICPECAKQKLM